MRILITNDDGIQSPGIRAVFEALRQEAECFVVAPHQECSAMGHSISLYRHIVVEQVDLGGATGHSIEGTPADCVKFAVAELAKSKIDLVISGINFGLNSGISVYYSGTVSAAREGLINGIPAIAISQARGFTNDFSYSTRLLKYLVKGYESHAFSRDTFLNINIPPRHSNEIKGVKVAKQADSRFAEWCEVSAAKEGNGKQSYLIKGDMEVFHPDGTSDEEVMKAGFASITPLKLDLTYYERMAEVGSWIKNYKS